MQDFTCYGILFKELMKRERKCYLFCLFCKYQGKFVPTYYIKIRTYDFVSIAIKCLICTCMELYLHINVPRQKT
jgi:hypothetical protein